MRPPDRALPVVVAVSCLWSVGAVGEDFLVNQVTADRQGVAGIATTPEHGFVVVWSSVGQDGSGIGTYARWFDCNAVPLGDELPVNVTTASDQTAQGVATDMTGRAVVVWLSANQDGDDLGVFVRRFDAGGIPLGDELQVNTYTSGRQQYASVAAAGTGEFVVVWSGPLAGGGTGISARRFSSEGVPMGDEFVVQEAISAYRHLTTSVAVTSGFSFVAAWDTGSQVFARRFDSNGVSLGPSFLVSTEPVPPDTYLDRLGRVEADDTGAFVVTWTREDTLETVAHYASRYGPGGAAEWSIQTSSWAGLCAWMSVAAGGDLLTVWSDEYCTVLIGRRYRADGTPASDAVVLASHSFYGALIDPRVDHLGNDPDEWAMVWTDSRPDIGWDVHGLLSPAWVFGDGFESGGLSGWSGASP